MAAEKDSTDILLWLAGAVVAGMALTWLVISQPWARDEPSSAPQMLARAVSDEKTTVADTRPDEELETETGGGGTKAAAIDEPAVALDSPLRMAELAVRAGMLLEPEGYSAWSLYQQALRQQPGNAAARQGLRSVADLLMNRASVAIEQSRTTDAIGLIETVRAAIPDHPEAIRLADELSLDATDDAPPAAPAQVAELKASPSRQARQERPTARLEQPRIAPSARVTRPAAATRASPPTNNPFEDAAKAFETALANGKLLAPADASARYQLLTMAELKPDDKRTTKARKALTDALLTRADESIDAVDTVGADVWLTQAEQLGADPLRTASARLKLDQKIIDREAARPIPVAELNVVNYVPPRYPNRAVDRGLEGWVDVEFTVNLDGQPRDITVLDASHERYFRKEAVDAVSQWSFEPHVVRGSTVAQRTFAHHLQTTVVQSDTAAQLWMLVSACRPQRSRAVLILTTPWTAHGLDRVEATLRVALRLEDANAPALVLLPHADGGPEDATATQATIEQLGELAARQGIFLAASAYVRDDINQAVSTRGFLLNPDGQVLLNTPKVLPDLTAHFTDSSAATFHAADFASADTSAGRVGIVCGEDALSPHLVRALVVSGAEIVLNPAREFHDEGWHMRMQARAARAYENVALVATASPRTLNLSGDTIRLPASTQWADNWGQITASNGDESFLAVNPDIEGLRQRRLETRANFPAIVRMNVYAPSLQARRPRPKQAPQTREDWQTLAAERVRAQTPPPRADVELRYDVALCQHVVHQSSKPEQLIPNRQRNLDDVLELAQRVARAPSTRLVLLPEFFISGPVSPLGNRLGHLAEQIGVQMDGPEIAQLAEFARANKTFMAGGVFEFDPEWPNRFFNTAFILDDAGELILRYRKIHCGDVMGFLPDTTPGSVYTAFVERYGYESLFPVVDTVLGRLAANICFDMNFPETHRELVRRGAEVILHPTSEPHNRGRRGWDIGRHVRAFENTAYILSAGHGGEWVGDYPAVSTRARGNSKIVNFDGTLQAVVDTAGRSPLSGNIDLAALRRARAQAYSNLVLWDDPISYAHEYAATPRGIPNNVWTDDPFGNPYAGGREIQKVVEAYIQRGIFVAPAGQ